MNSRSLGAFLLLIAGFGFIVAGSRSCDFQKIPNVINVKYPDCWIVIIEESSERSPETAILLANKTWRDSLETRKINWRIYDKDQAEAERYSSIINSLPCVIFITPDGKVVNQSPLPADAKSFDKLISEIMGK